MKNIILFTLLSFAIEYVVCSLIIKFLPKFIDRKLNIGNNIGSMELETFSIPAYFDRMEQAALDILEKQDPIDRTVILWWGLDGLRLNEDETLEWISRKKPKPVMQNVFYQPCQSIQADVESKLRIHSQTQSTRAQIEELMMRNAALQNQATQYAQCAAMMSMLSPPIMPVYPYYSPYMQPPYLQSSFASPLTQCCCNYGSLTH